jgi:hypothetical protein
MTDRRLLDPLLEGDVLKLSVVGVFDIEALDELVATAQGHRFGAILLDLSRSTPGAMSADELAEQWLEQLPRVPCAVCCGSWPVGYCGEVARLLAASEDRPTPMHVFAAGNEAEAMAWCNDYAVTFRVYEGQRPRGDGT